MWQGALGFGTEEDEYEPEAVQIQADIDYIGSGHYHSFAVTQEGKLWSWGCEALIAALSIHILSWLYTESVPDHSFAEPGDVKSTSLEDT